MKLGSSVWLLLALPHVASAFSHRHPVADNHNALRTSTKLFLDQRAFSNEKLLHRDILHDVSRSVAKATAAAATIGALVFGTPADLFFRTHAWADDTTTSMVVTQQQQSTSPVMEEVWGLIDKYYIDRSFNGQDWKQVRQRYFSMSQQADDEKTMKLITDMVKSLGDKYTRILTKDQYAAIQKFDLIGVGVTLMPDAQKNIIVGAPPVEGSPAAKANLQAGDFVTAVNGVPTASRTAFDIIDQIAEDPKAKTVTFTIMRQGENDLAGEGKTFDATLERQNLIQVKDPIQYKVSERRPDGTTVGYIRVSEFNSLVKPKLEDALADLKKQGANAFVMDLRMNTGGAFQSAVEISGLFLDDRIATYVVDSNNVELPFKTTKGKMAIDSSAPMVIWIDGTSASASEVLAGSLHDNCRAVTMGDKSFGKGLIQAVYGLKNGAGLVITVAKYVTPTGSEIQGIGITPDIEGNVPAPPIIPRLSTDTSKVDFGEIRRRLGPDMCTVPTERIAPKGMEFMQIDASDSS